MRLTGAGVVLLEVNKRNDENINMVLVREISGGKYTEPGGSREKNVSILETARNELYEETAAYVWFPKVSLLNQGNNWIDVRNRKYRVYIILIDELIFDDYYDNYDNLDQLDFKSSFKETDVITRVSIKKLKKVVSGKGCDLEVKDIFNETIFLKKRTINVLRDMFFGGKKSIYSDIIKYNPILSFKRVESNDIINVVFG